MWLGYAPNATRAECPCAAEQAKAFLDLPDQLMAGLNLINQQDLCYFQPVHQAELFRLKGVFLQVAPQKCCCCSDLCCSSMGHVEYTALQHISPILLKGLVGAKLPRLS